VIVVGLGIGWRYSGFLGVPGAPTLTYATSRVIWRRSGCHRGEGPGAKL